MPVSDDFNRQEPQDRRAYTEHEERKARIRMYDSATVLMDLTTKVLTMLGNESMKAINESLKVNIGGK